MSFYVKLLDIIANFTQENAQKYKNITLHTAFMGAMFGTHHSKVAHSRHIC